MQINRDEVRTLENKYDAKCPCCNEPIAVRSRCYYHIKIKKCIHIGCIDKDLPSYNFAPVKRPKIFGLWSQTEVIAALFKLNCTPDVMRQVLGAVGVEITPSTESTIATTCADIRGGRLQPRELSTDSLRRLKQVLTDLQNGTISVQETQQPVKPASAQDLSEYVKHSEMGKALAEMTEKFEEQIDAIEQRQPLEVIIRKSEKITVKAGVQHCMFPEVLFWMQLGENVWLTGPAGSGKTRCAREVAKHLGLTYYSKSLCKMTPVSHLLGYMDAHGKYVSTDFRKCLEHGGLFLLDECDAGSPDVLTAFNDALAADAGDMISFPDKMVKKHADFVAIAAANTYGSGANRQYVARLQQDAAALDRFVFLDFPYDEALENHVAGDLKWTARVQLYRQAADELGIRHIISPRASIKGSKALKAGADLKKVESALIWKGLEAESVLKIQAKCALLSDKYKIA